MKKLFVIALLFSSCAATKTIETDLYFGQSIPGGGEVSAAAWNQYQQETIATLFTSGFSLHKLTGFWYDPDLKEQVTEHSHMISVVNKLTPQLSKRIDSIALIYKQRFHQQAVLRVDKKARMKLL